MQARVVSLGLLAIALVLAATDAFAPFETRNGGYGVVEDGVLYSYDLHISDVHREPYVGDEAELPADEAQTVETYLQRLALEPATLSIVTRKLASIRDKATALGLRDVTTTMLGRMRDFTWLKLNIACIDVHDETDPIPTKVQVAYREGSFVRFCRDFFSRLAPEQQAAVIVHELVYTTSENLDAVIAIVGMAFSPAFSDFGDAERAALKAALTALEQASTQPSSAAFARSTPDAFGRFFVRVREGRQGAGFLVSSPDPFLVDSSLGSYRRGMLPQYVAASACEYLELAGIRGWRLGTLEDLRAMAALDIAAVDGLAVFSWFVQPDGDTFRAVSLESGGVLSYPRFEEENTVCVKDPAG